MAPLSVVVTLLLYTVASITTGSTAGAIWWRPLLTMIAGVDWSIRLVAGVHVTGSRRPRRRRPEGDHQLGGNRRRLLATVATYSSRRVSVIRHRIELSV